jgi:hypothetical protein
MLEYKTPARHNNLMKIPISLRIVLAGAVLAALGACAMYPTSGHDALVGTWTNSFGTVWMIKADGTFDVDLKHQSKRDAWGNWTVSGDQVTIQRSGGMKPKGCDGPGVYKFARTEKETLQFTLVSDKCKLRIKNVTQPWKKK